MKIVYTYLPKIQSHFEILKKIKIINVQNYTPL